MRKDILLTFLSKVTRFDSDGNPEAIHYEGLGDCRTTNVPAVRYLCKNGHVPSMVFAFTTNVVRNNVVGHNVAVTHEQYFRSQVREVIAGIDDCYSSVAYDENGTADDSLDCVLTMAEAVRDYVSELPEGTEVTLHVDLTGGMRHSNMMMIVLMRLIEYSGVQVGDILYANITGNAVRVERVNNIYSMFNLLAGASEFVNYGSVKALEAFFPAATRSLELAILIVAMRNFSDEIKLCHAGKLVEAAKELATAIRNFGSQKKTNTAERLMAQLETRIMHDYSTLLHDDSGALELIEWCLERDYLQQALTLYVERVPEVLLDKGIITLTPKLRECVESQNVGSDNLALFFLTKMVSSKAAKEVEKLAPAVGKSYSDLQRTATDRLRGLKNLLRGLMNGLKNDSVTKEEALQQWRDYLYADDTVEPDNLERSERHLLELFSWHENPEILADMDVEGDSFYAQLAKRVCDTTQGLDEADFAALSSGQQLSRIVNYLANSISEKDMAKLFTNIRPQYATRLVSMADAGLLLLSVTSTEFRAILDDYRDIKQERNSSNHARLDEEVRTADELKAKIREAIVRIRKAIPERSPVVE